MKTQLGLGVLSIPTAFDSLGMVPGVICLCVVGVITTWSNCVIGTFKLQHPQVYGIDDAGALMFGLVGRGVLGAAFCLCTSSLPDINRSVSLTFCILDIRHWIRYTRHFHWTECSFNPRRLHCCICRHCRCSRIPLRQYPNPGPYHLACMDRSPMYHRRK